MPTRPPGRRPRSSLLGLAVALALSIAPGERSAPASPTFAVPAFVTPVPLGMEYGVRGRVRLVGKPPAPRPPNKYFDPKCPSSAQQDGAVLVDKNGGLRNVVVRIAPGQLQGEPARKPVRVRHDGCVMLPRTVALTIDQEIELVNEDSTTHNVRGWISGGTNIFVNLPPGAAPVKQTISGKPVSVRLGCDHHYPESTWVVVTDHPYFAVTGEDGTFRIDGVPPGHYRLEALHVWYGTRTQEIDLLASGGVVANFTYEAPTY